MLFRSVKQDFIADSTMEAEYVAAAEAAKEAIWLRKLLLELGVVFAAEKPIVMHCDNTGAIAQCKEPRNHKKGKHIQGKYHLIREFIQNREIVVEQIASANNLATHLLRPLLRRSSPLMLSLWELG